MGDWNSLEDVRRYILENNHRDPKQLIRTISEQVGCYDLDAAASGFAAPAAPVAGGFIDGEDED